MHLHLRLDDNSLVLLVECIVRKFVQNSEERLFASHYVIYARRIYCVLPCIDFIFTF